MQRQLENMSTRGDSLDNLKQRRNSAHRKADDTAVQLKKMSPENKYYAMHTEALKRLRTDVRKMDSEIKLEDAAFGDFKRTTTKVWMTLKFGGLHDCCQKGTVRNFHPLLSHLFLTSCLRLREDMENWSLP